MPKILLCSNTAWYLYNFRGGLIKSLLEIGMNVITVAPNDQFTKRLSDLGCTTININLSAKGVNPLQDAKIIINLYKIYKAYCPNIILNFTIKPNIYGAVAAKLCNIPCINTVTGLGYTFISNDWITRLARILYKIAFLFPKKIFFQNKDDQNIFLTHHLVSAKKTDIIAGSGVNLDYFKPQPISSSDEKFRFLLIARLLWDKGIKEYIEAARYIRHKNPNVIFQILGSCEAKNPSIICREQVYRWEQEGIIEYLGTREDVRPIISQADCVVLPSYREGIPRTLIESAAMAKPLITSDAPGCKEVVVDGKTGLICKTKDAQSLANCCSKMLQMTKKEREHMGQAGLQFVTEHFDEKKVIQKYIEDISQYMR